ncbi:MAG TPA: S8 family serine peptidase [Methylomirabilota bacterium]|nr:S8 family serine peptidase [Methylomirabilota bacterium]
MAGGSAGEESPGIGSDRRLGIILGASRFPNLRHDSPRLGAAFARSKAETSRYLKRLCEDMLDCFDSPQLPNALCLRIAKFLEQHPLATDLVVYYVGHGGFLGTQEYFLACRATREQQKHATGLRVGDLAASIIGSFRNRRVYLILDCCFAGTAADSFQAGSDDLIAKQSDRLPTGVSLLNASSREEAAIVPEGGARTMFSECLLEVLKQGIPSRGERLTLREVRNAVADVVTKRYPENAVRPEVHSPRQRDGDVADIPFFPNPAYVRPASKDATALVARTADQFAGLYNFPASLDGKGECIGIIALSGGTCQESDLQKYFTAINKPVPSIKYVSVAGTPPETADYAAGHLTFEVEICGSVAPAARLVAYRAPNSTTGFVEAIGAATSDDENQPGVLLITWGASESNWTRQAIEAMQRALVGAALRGMTVCCASGDQGAIDSLFGTRAEVDFPASSPYVLACGGTSLRIVDGEHRDEIAWSRGGGGASDVFPQPDWQGEGISVRDADGSLKTGRAIPDVSAHADPDVGYRAFVRGQWKIMGGTTAAAALWAGLICLINQAVGRRPAFTHQDLYRYYGPAGALRDITVGNNGAGRHPGYDAGPGWDACTGWGSPDGVALVLAAKLRDRFRALESPPPASPPPPNVETSKRESVRKPSRSRMVRRRDRQARP